MTKHRLLFILSVLLLALGVWTPPADAQASAAVDVNVTFTRALVINAGDPIQFGNVTINGNPGSVLLDKTTGVVVGSGGVVSIDQATSQRGFIQFNAPRPGSVGITAPSSITLSLSPPDPSAPLEQVTFSPAVEVTQKTISEYNEEVIIMIGGTLNFIVNTREGLYNGTVQVDVAYS